MLLRFLSLLPGRKWVIMQEPLLLVVLIVVASPLPHSVANLHRVMCWQANKNQNANLSHGKYYTYIDTFISSEPRADQGGGKKKPTNPNPAKILLT